MRGDTRRGEIVVGFALVMVSFLIFEVVWQRRLTHVLGSSAYATTTVLISFMTGLALGSFIFGKIVDKSENPLKLFAVILLGIGGYGILTIHMFSVLHYPYKILHDVFHETFLFHYTQFLMCFFALLIPTVLMGGIFPVLVKLYTEDFRFFGKDLGDLYFIDTMGAAVGSFLGGVLLIPFIGQDLTIGVSSMINIALGVFFYTSAPSGRIIGKERIAWRPHINIKESTLLDKTILVSFYLSGFAALSYELIWTDMMSLVFGSGTYAFAMMLTSFFGGLAIGSVIMGRLVDRIKSPLMVFGVLEAFIGIFCMALIPGFSHLDIPYLAAVDWLRSSPYLIMVSWIVIPFLLLVPTTLMGATLPLVGKIYTRGEKELGTDTGAIFSINTIGGILGSWWTGFIFIPYLGIERTNVIAASSNILAAVLIFGCVLKLLSHQLDKQQAKIQLVRARWGFLGLIAVSSIIGPYFFTYSIDPSHAGVYYVAKNIDMDLWRNYKENQDVLYSKETLYGFVTVTQTGPDRNFVINGKIEASTNPGDMNTQRLLAYLPLLIHPEPKKVLNIGLGAGVTAGSVTEFDVEELDIIEINPEVARVASTYFGDYNGDVLSDTRVDLIIADARDHLATEHDIYDVIISDPQDVWNMGASNLFTQEFYRSAKDHLEDGGIFVQYIGYTDYTLTDFRILLSTLKHAFAYVTVWDSENTFILIASQEDIIPNYERLKEGLVMGNIEDAVLVMGEEDPLFSFLARLVLSSSEVDDLVVETVNTDDKPILEFATNRNLLRKHKDPYTDLVETYMPVISSSLGGAPQGLWGVALEDGWTEDAAGYMFDFVPAHYTHFPVGYRKMAHSSYAKYTSSQGELSVIGMPVPTLERPGDDPEDINTRVGEITEGILKDRQAEIGNVRMVFPSGEVGYLISASGPDGAVMVLSVYCEKDHVFYFITLDHPGGMGEAEMVMHGINHGHG